MKVALVNLPWFKEERLGVRAGSRWPFTAAPEPDGCIHYIPFPFFLAYTTALLKRNGVDVLFIDAIAERMSEDVCLKKIGRFSPGLIVIETSAPSLKNDLRLMQDIKKDNKDSQVLFCGAHAGERAADLLRNNADVDYVITGEYEEAVCALVTALSSGLGLNRVAGLTYRTNHEVVVYEMRACVNDLDALPWPERPVNGMYNYNDGFAGLPVPNVQMLASRGCPFTCSFCLLPQTIYKGTGYRKRNPVDIVNEMESLVRDFHFKAVYFDDDTFNADRKHVIAISEEIIRRKMSIPWAIMARVDLMDEELLAFMTRAGLYAVKYGIESADDQVRSLCHKDLNLQKARSVIAMTQQMGVKVHLTFCIGLPGENQATVQQTIDFIKETKPDSLQFSFATPFPGTAYYRFVQSKGWLLSRDEEDYDGNERPIVMTEDLSVRELENIRTMLYGIFEGKCG